MKRLFKKYPSLSNNPLKFLEHVENMSANPDLDDHVRNNIKELYDDIRTESYVVTEKADGSNLGLYVSPKSNDLVLASRNQFVDEGFLRSDELAADLKSKIEKINDDYHPIENIIIYGELVCNKINGRVFYSKDPKFIVFDIYSESVGFWPFSKMKTFCKYYNFNMVPLLFRGSLYDCLSFSCDFKSKISQECFSDSVESNNFAEGFVVKPENKDLRFGHDRIIFKIKAESFSEVSRQKKTNIAPSDEVSRLIKAISQYVTENRYLSVISKMEEIDYSNKRLIGSLIGLYIKDVWSDFITNHPWVEESFSKEEKKQIRKSISHDVQKLIYPKFF